MIGGTQVKQLTVNDFFCGCGGMGIGFKNAGYEIVGAWDFDKFAVESYKANVGDHVQQADIKDMTWEDIPTASVWAFGFPCQDLSIAGKQAGMMLECIKCKHKWKVDPDEHNGDNCPECGGSKYKSASRSGLFFEIMRFLDETEENSPEQMPKVLVAENVKGLKPFIGVLETEFQKRGYTAHIELYNSKYWGVPQNRERYYIVGIKDGENIPFQMPIEDKNPERIPKLSTVLDPEVDEKYYISDDKAKTIIGQALKRLQELGKVHVEKRQNGRRAKTDEEEMFTLTAQDIHGVIIDDTFGYENEPRVYDETSPTLRGGRHGLKIIEGEEEAVIIQTPRGKNRGGVHEVAPTLTANSYEQNNFICEKDSLKDDIQKCFTTKDGIAYACNATYQKGIVVNNALRCGARTMIVVNDRGFINREPQVSEIAPTLRAESHGNHPKVIEKIICKESGLLDPEDIGKTLRVGGHGSLSKKHNYQHVLAKETPDEAAKLKLVGMLDMKDNEGIRRVYDPEGISPTLTASQGGHRQPKIFDFSRYRVRRLTPTEYGRLQAFPMGEWKQVVSDTQAYKQFGNAVTTTVATAVAEAIKTILPSKNSCDNGKDRRLNDEEKSMQNDRGGKSNAQQGSKDKKNDR